MAPWENIEFQYPNVPTMITPEERQYLYWLGACYWRGFGHIIEIGPWLGGSTICLAAGMRDNPQTSNYKLHVFDNFRWRAFMAERAPLPLSVGSSFQSYFERNIEKYSKAIAVHRQSLPDGPVALDKLAQGGQPKKNEKDPIFSWDIKQPIEILFIDGAKSWNGFCYLLISLSNYLKPNQTLIVCQDYKFWGSYWVPLIMEALSNYFEIEHNLSNNTASFQIKSEINAQDIEKIGSIEIFDKTEGLSLLESASQRLLGLGDNLGAFIIQACKIRFCLQKGDTAHAEALFRNLESSWPLYLDGQTIDAVRNWLELETGKRYRPTPRWHSGTIIRKLKRKAARLAAIWD